LNFVLDASVVLAWAFEDEGGDYAVGVLEELRSSEAVAASLWPLEVTNGLVTAERRGRLGAPDGRRFLHLLLSLPIVVDPVGRRRAFEGVHALARTHGLTSYDAAYLELAVRYGIPVATLDEPLRKAVRAEGLSLFAA
jgi:predicted nucleic acid-binding protein